MRLRLALLLALTCGATLVAVPHALGAPPAPPATAPDLDPASDSGTSAIDNITNDITPSFTISAPGAVGATVTLYLATVGSDGTPGTPQPYGTALVPSNGTVSITPSPSLADGVYVVHATTKLGTEESGPSPIIQMQVDTEAPILAFPPILADAVPGLLDYTYTSTPAFYVLAPLDTIVDLYEGSTFLGQGTSAELNDESGTAAALVRVVTALDQGPHSVYALGVDPAGNQSPQPTGPEDFIVDSIPADASQPDLLAADDDGASSTDDTTQNPRPRFVVESEPGARVTIYEDGIALGAAKADSAGNATIRVSDLLWFEPGEHCVYAIAIDPLGNAGAESPPLCVNILEGVEPFTSNLGLALAGNTITLSMRSTVAARATVRLLDGARTVKTVRARLGANTRTILSVALPKSLLARQSVRVRASFRSQDGRRIVVDRIVRHKRPALKDSRQK